MRNSLLIVILASFLASAFCADSPAPKRAAAPTSQPVQKITPGKVIVPIKAMRRLYGELLSVDYKTRTGTFRADFNEEVMPFIVLPYAEMLHNAAEGELEDFRIGKHALFRMHQNDEGKWVWLTYIQDELFHLNSHSNYYFVDSIDPAKHQIAYNEANLKKEPAYGDNKGVIETDADTHYWKNAQPAKFEDINVGDTIRAKTHGTGSGKHHVAWEIFLDDASLQKYREEQQATHSKRLLEDGWPGYVDTVSPEEVHLTLFQSGHELAASLTVGAAVRIAACGVDLKPADAVEGTVTQTKPNRKLNEVTITLKSQPKQPLIVTGVARVWIIGAKPAPVNAAR